MAADMDPSKLPPASSKKGVTYAADIKPMLDNGCIKCHGEQRPKARLRLDNLEGILKGSENGKVITPGDSTKGVLVYAVSHLLKQDEWMPPPGNRAGAKPLTKEEIGLLRAWIDQGAK